MFLELLIAVVWGLIAGGIVNALADDLPLRRDPRLPRYVPEAKKRAIHIPHLDEDGNDVTEAFIEQDDTPRPPIAWLGLTAFLFNKRTSPDGSVRLGWRYPLTELLSVFLMVITVLAVDHANATDTAQISTLQTIFWLIYMAIFTLIIVIDIEHKLILFVVIIPSSILAIIDALITSTQPTLQVALIGGAAGFGVFFLMYNGGYLFTYIAGILRSKPIKEVAFGYGDVMMAMLSGLILGWRVLIFAMFITVFLGAFGAVLFLLTKAIGGKRYSAFTAIPYGPYIVAGTILMLLFRDTLGPAMFGAVFPP